MNKTLIKTLFLAILFTPSFTFAAGLSEAQANAILMVLRAFGVEESVVLNVKSILIPIQLPKENPVGKVVTTTTPVTPQQDVTVSVLPTAPVGSIMTPMNEIQIKSQSTEDRVITITLQIKYNDQFQSLMQQVPLIKTTVKKDGEDFKMSGVGSNFRTNDKKEMEVVLKVVEPGTYTFNFTSDAYNLAKTLEVVVE